MAKTLKIGRNDKRDMIAELDGIIMDVDSLPEEDREGGIDVRLQIQEDGSWSIHAGDAQYDTDHTGYWGASMVDSDSDAGEVVLDLVGQAMSDFAQCQG